MPLANCLTHDRAEYNRQSPLLCSRRKPREFPLEHLSVLPGWRQLPACAFHGSPICKFVGCDKRQRRHTRPVIRCACALLVTPYELPIVNSWPVVRRRGETWDNRRTWSTEKGHDRDRASCRRRYFLLFRFIGFTNTETMKAHLPFELNGMVILEDEQKTRFPVRAKNIKMIVVAAEADPHPPNR